MIFADWIINGFDRDAAVSMTNGGVNPLVAVFLSSRGVRLIGDAQEFLTDNYSLIADPFLLEGMSAAVARIRRAMRDGERVAIYGDYDVDGMTASSLLADFLRRRGAACEIYIPGRADEGYGLNRQALDRLSGRGATLIITVDCGITAIDEAVYAGQLGLDLIITDHHECKESIPEAVAVINPKQPGCGYPNKSLAGVGVAFKLVCALDGGDIRALLDTYADLVAVGTIADVMPVTGENRVLIRSGLRALGRAARPGLKALTLKSCAPRREINTAAVGYWLAPRLNAAGRMGRASLATELLLTADEGEAAALAAELDELNNRRRRLESEIFDEASVLLDKTKEAGPIVLAGVGWYQGVMGIVAAKIAERKLSPAVMISLEDGVGRGSCRSFGSFKLYSALASCSELLINFGGHEMAAGLTILEENIPEFKRRIGEYYHEHVKITPIPAVRADFEVTKPELLSIENVEALGRMEPYGSQNPPPFLCLTDAMLTSLVPVGGGKHSRLTVSKNGKSFDCIFFSHAPGELDVSSGTRVDIIFEPQINEFRSRKSVQLHIIDIRTTANEE